MLRARPQRLETPSDDEDGSTSGTSDDVPVYRASGLSLGMSSTNSWRTRMNTKDALLSPGPVALGKRRRPQDQGLEVRNSYETQVSHATHASHASAASQKTSASQELTPEQRELAREAQKNRERLAADLKAGLAELLELHNTEELRTLCKTLEIGRLGSKKSNFAAVLALLADGAEEAGCRRVLDGVWDGIIIEYLRSLGKNLMKCKDDIRGAALQHWKRNTAAVIGARAAGSQGLAAPVFMKGSVWRRTNATSDTDVQVRRFLRRLEATEGDLKNLEKGVRARPDFEMVTKFLAQIHVVRDLEEDFRDELLNMLQDLLGERDVMLESAKRAATEANEARARARDIEKHDVSRSFFVGLADVMHQQRILESIRIQVEITQRERDIEALHDKIARMIRAHVLQEGELRLRIEELETDLADTSETLRLRSECLADTESKLLERDEELAALRGDFDAFRVGAEALIAGSLVRSSQAEADALQASEFAKRERWRAKKLEGELEDAMRKIAEANQQRECVEMEAADREALEVRADEALRHALQLEEEEKALAAEELAKASAEKGKGKSKGKGKGPGKGKSGKGGKASPAGKKGGKSSPTAGKKDGKASPKSPAKKSGKKSPAGAKKAKKR